MSKPYGDKTRKTVKRSASTPISFSEILPAVGQAMRLDEKVREWTVLSLWESIIDPAFKGKIHAVMIKTKKRQKHLIIKTADSAVASEITFYLEAYKTKINGYKQETGCEIHQIDIWIGT